MLSLLSAELLRALWIFLPAGAANIFPPLSRFIKNRHPIDFGIKLGNERLFGDGKTWEGFIIGLAASISVGTIEYLLYPLISQYTSILPALTPLTIIIIPIGALVGDMFGSLVKRRLEMKRGENAMFLDQLDFIVGAMIFTYPLIDYTWLMIVLILILAFVFHRITSIIGYKLKVKREPW